MSELKEHFSVTNDLKLQVVHTQDCTPILEKAKMLRELQPGSRKGRGKIKDYHHVASIPESIIQHLINEGRLRPDFQGDREQMAKLYLIVKQEFPNLLTTERKFGQLFKG